MDCCRKQRNGRPRRDRAHSDERRPSIMRCSVAISSVHMAGTLVGGRLASELPAVPGAQKGKVRPYEWVERKFQPSKTVAGRSMDGWRRLPALQSIATKVPH